MKNYESFRYCIQAITSNGNTLVLTSNDFEIDFIESNRISYITDIELFDSVDEAKVYIAENEIEKWCKENYNVETASDETEMIISLNVLPILIGIKYAESIKITDI
jgi:hypothetical protein